GLALTRAQDAVVPPPSTGPVEPLVDNPHYLAWSKFKPGTQVDLDMILGVGGQKMTSNVTMTLSEVSAEKAVVESVAKMNLPGLPGGGGQPEKQSHTHLAKVPKSEADRAFMPPGAVGDSKETGTETIAAAGKSYECKVREFTGKIKSQDAKGKMWRSEQVPGGLVKMEALGSPNMTVTMELKKVTAK
ncbi:MAG: hypothetical protein M3478_16225, partial [Planctomycetota bacterium]|nr:hypothetical protein [Planctomycetota bacterium]